MQNMDGTAMNTYQEDNWKFPHYEIGKKIDWEHLCQKFTWLNKMKGVEQDPEWHAEGDVYIHTQMVTECAISSDEYRSLDEQDKHILFAAAIMHDIEKPNTTRRETVDGKERVTSPNHAKYGEGKVRTLLYRDITTPFSVREEISKLVRYHGLPLWAIGKRDPQKAIIAVSHFLDTRLLYLLAKADVDGRYCEDKDDILLAIELFKELCLENDCFGKPKEFSTDHARFNYLSKDNVLPNFEPYDDMEFEVVVMSAIPGTGKDHYIENNLDLPSLSLDEIRRKNKIKVGDKRGQGRVIQAAKEQAKVFMRKKQSFVFNATNITKDMRGKWISLFLDYNARVKIVYLEVPYSTLKRQNAQREYSLPQGAIEKLLGKLDIPDCTEAHSVECVTTS